MKVKPHSNAAALQSAAAKAREAKTAAAAAASSSRAYETLGGEAGAGVLQPGVTVAILSGPHGGSVGKITNSFGFEAMVGVLSFFPQYKIFDTHPVLQVLLEHNGDEIAVDKNRLDASALVVEQVVLTLHQPRCPL